MRGTVGAGQQQRRPDVTGVEVSTPFWSVVEPPWDASSVGTEECPVADDGSCPEHCAQVSADRFVADATCFEPEVVTCDRNPLRITPGVELCRVRTATSTLYRFGGLGPLEPGFLGWRECTEEEYEQAVSSSPQCGSE